MKVLRATMASPATSEKRARPVSAPAAARAGFELHRWSGDVSSPPSKGVALPQDFDVQSLIVAEDGKRLLLFSDDSEVRVPVDAGELCQSKLNDDGTCACSDVEGQGAKRFRARWVSLDELTVPASKP